jgi:hypothetical protein
VTRTLLTRVAARAREPALICLLGLPATTPLWKSSLPRSFDGLFHLFRLLEIDQLAHQGVLFPRWAPDLLFGYGYPLFDFVPHLPYYVSEVLYATGLSLVHAMLLSFGLALVASGLAMYVYVRDVFGSRAAIVSAVAYMYAPFHLYDVLFRGHLPGAWAMVLFPLTLWSFRRLIRNGGAVYWTSSILLYAGCFLSHNPANFIFTPFLVCYLVLLIWLSAGRRRSAAFRGAAALLVGAGLTAFFWLPALWDRQFIQIDRMITPPDLDYHTHFITVADLLAPPSTATTGLMNPEVPNTLGPVLISLSIVSIIGLRRLHGSEERAHLLICLCGLAGVLFMVLPQSVAVWDGLSLLKYLVFPHRFLRLACLLMAMLCGAACRLFADQEGRFSPSFAVALTSVGMIVVFSLPLLYPPYYSQLALDPSFADMMQFERATGTMGTTSFGEYLPVWVEWIPHTSPLELMYLSGSSIWRLDESNLPEGTVISGARFTPTSATVNVSVPQPFQATFDSLYFPGWRGYVDGQRTEITPTPGLGLSSIFVPSGEHTVELRFEDTPLRTTSRAISVSSAVALLLLVAVAFVRGARCEVDGRPSKSGTPATLFEGHVGRLTGPQTVALALVPAALLIVKLGILDQYDTPFRRGFDGLHVPGVQKPLEVNFGDQITLLGYDLAASHAHPGDTVTVTLYWKANRPLDTDYSAFVHLVDERLNIYAQKDSLNPGRYPTHLWPTAEYNEDTHEVLIPPGTPPGQYLLGVGLYDQTTMVRLPVLGEERQEIGMYFLEPISVVRGESPPTIEELGIQSPATVRFDNGMTMLGSTAERNVLPPGDFYRLALFWKAEHALDESYSVAIRVLNGQGEEVLGQTGGPSAGGYPTTAWEEGEIVRDNHALRIPRDFPTGEYVIQLAVLDPTERLVPITAAEGLEIEDGWLQLSSVRAGS